MTAITHVSWLIPSDPCSRPPAKVGSTSSTTSVVVDIAVPMMERAAALLKTASQSTAGMMMSPSDRASAVGYALRPLQPVKWRPSGRHVRITPAPNHDRLKDPQPNAQSAAKVGATFLARDLQGRPLWKRRQSKPLSQSSRNGHLLTRSSSPLQWAE